MTFNYDKAQIMRNAHAFYHDGRFGDFSDCLRKAWENAKVRKALCEEADEVLHTWYEWTLLGREVIHEQKTVAQAEMWSMLKKSIRGIKSFFRYGQTCELGTQPPKA